MAFSSLKLGMVILPLTDLPSAVLPGKKCDANGRVCKLVGSCGCRRGKRHAKRTFPFHLNYKLVEENQLGLAVASEEHQQRRRGAGSEKRGV